MRQNCLFSSGFVDNIATSRFSTAKGPLDSPNFTKFVPQTDKSNRIACETVSGEDDHRIASAPHCLRLVSNDLFCRLFVA